MPKPKVLEEVTAPTIISGYRPKRSVRRIVAMPDSVISPFTKRVAAQMEPEDGAEPFWADIRDDLTFAEMDSVKPSAPFADLWETIAPWVIAWNAIALDQVSGEWKAVPPPAEMGPEAFATQRTQVTNFIAWCIRLGDGLSDLPKGQRRSADTDGTPNESD
jgi:hypothetical protein